MRASWLSILTVAAWATAGLPTYAASEIPCRLHDGFLWVEVSAAGADKPLNFLLDTGAAVSVVEERVADRLGLKHGAPVNVAGVRTVVSGYWVQNAKAMLADTTLPGNLVAIDLSQLSRTCATPVDGLIGADFFRDRIVQIDFAGKAIRILTPEQARGIKGDLLALDDCCAMRVPVSVNGRKPQPLRLDTGCAAALHWVTKSSSLKLGGNRVAVGLTEMSLPTATVSATLGSNRFEEVPAVIHERRIFPHEDGLLGLGLLTQFSQVTIDTGAGRVILAR